MDSFKPCPFCASQKIVPWSLDSMGSGGVTFGITCEDCGVTFEGHSCPDTIRDAWNRREQ